MDESRKVVDVTDQELIEQCLLGDGAAATSIDFVNVVRRCPEQFQWLTIRGLRCLVDGVSHHPAAPVLVSPTSSRSSDGTVFSQSTDTTVDMDLVSLFERARFYQSTCKDPPPLIHRSDLQQRPFVVFQGRDSVISKKTIHGAVHEALAYGQWKEKVAPDIIAWLKRPEQRIRVSMIVAVQFSTAVENGPDVLDNHVTFMVFVHPGTTSETSCRDANPGILSILRKNGIDDAAVHWIEGAAEPLAGPPPMMPILNNADPTSYIRRAMTGVLGVPLASDRVMDQDGQGTLGLYFCEGKDRDGKPSQRVLALTNKHVTCADTTADYEYTGRQGDARQYIRNCGDRRFEQMLEETKATKKKKESDCKRFSEELAKLLARPEPADADERASNKLAAKRTTADMERSKEDLGIVERFHKELLSLSARALRELGWLRYAPRICHDLDKRRYLCDISIFELAPTKCKKNFKGNFAYLGGKFSPDEIKSFFYPNTANPPSFKYPEDHLLKIQGCVSRSDLFDPYLLDEKCRRSFIVAKVGQSSDLTFGRTSELDAYTCDACGNESWHVPVHNFDDTARFSAKGDSGAMIFNAEGKMVALLHSGVGAFGSFVTLGTPAYYVIELIKKRYPDADFNCEAL